MKTKYPVLISKDEEDYLVYIPDIDRMTEESSFDDAIYMAEELLGTWSLDFPLPIPSSASEAIQISKDNTDDEDMKWSEGELVFITIDPEEYRRKLQESKGSEESENPKE